MSKREGGGAKHRPFGGDGLAEMMARLADPQAESQALDLMLQGRELAERALSELHPDDFQDRRARLVFEGISSVMAREGEATLPAVRLELQQTGNFDEAGGNRWLGELIEQMTMAHELPSLIRVLRTKALERRAYLGIVAAGQDLENRAGLNRAEPSIRYVLEQIEEARGLGTACEPIKPVGPGLLHQAIKHLKERGLAGEEGNAAILFLALVSRTSSRPVNVFVSGPPAAGKSDLVKRVLTLFPKQAVITITSLSPKSPLYMEESFRHKFLFVAEADGIRKDPEAFTVLRAVCWDANVSAVTVQKDQQGKLVSKRMVRRGPAGLILTGVRETDPELASRMLNIEAQDSPEQSRAVLLATARTWGEAKDGQLDPYTAGWCELARGHGRKAAQVEIPFRSFLAERLPVETVRVRRDFSLLLQLVAAHATLEQEFRTRNAAGALIAEIGDYAVVASLLDIVLTSTRKGELTLKQRAAVDAVAACQGDAGATLQEIAKKLGRDRSSTHRRLAKPLKLKYVVNDEERRGKAARFKIGIPLEAETGSGLPPAQEVANALGLSGSWADPVTGEVISVAPAGAPSDCTDATPAEVVPA